MRCDEVYVLPDGAGFDALAAAYHELIFQYGECALRHDALIEECGVGQ